MTPSRSKCYHSTSSIEHDDDYPVELVMGWLVDSAAVDGLYSVALYDSTPTRALFVPTGELSAKLNASSASHCSLEFRNIMQHIL